MPTFSGRNEAYLLLKLSSIFRKKNKLKEENKTEYDSLTASLLIHLVSLFSLSLLMNNLLHYLRTKFNNTLDLSALH